MTTWYTGITVARNELVKWISALTWLNGNVKSAFPIPNYAEFPVVFLHLQSDQPDWNNTDTVASVGNTRHVLNFKLHYENELEDVEDVNNQENIRLREIGSIVDVVNGLTSNPPYWDKMVYSNVQISQEAGIKPNYTLSIMEMDIQVAVHFDR